MSTVLHDTMDDHFHIGLQCKWATILLYTITQSIAFLHNHPSSSFKPLQQKIQVVKLTSHTDYTHTTIQLSAASSLWQLSWPEPMSNSQHQAPNLCISTYDKHYKSIPHASSVATVLNLLSTSLYVSKRRWSLVGCHVRALWPNGAS